MARHSKTELRSMPDIADFKHASHKSPQRKLKGTKQQKRELSQGYKNRRQ